MCGGNAEVQTNGLGMSDVKITVRFRRETCLYLSVVFTLFQVVLYYLFNEVQALLFACFFAFYFCHNAIVIRIVVQKYDYFFVYRYFTGIYPLFFSDFLSGRRQTRTVKAGVFCMRIKATHVAFLLHAADLCVL